MITTPNPNPEKEEWYKKFYSLILKFLTELIIIFNYFLNQRSN